MEETRIVVRGMKLSFCRILCLTALLFQTSGILCAFEGATVKDNGEKPNPGKDKTLKSGDKKSVATSSETQYEKVKANLHTNAAKQINTNSDRKGGVSSGMKFVAKSIRPSFGKATEKVGISIPIEAVDWKKFGVKRKIGHMKGDLNTERNMLTKEISKDSRIAAIRRELATSSLSKRGSDPNYQGRLIADVKAEPKRVDMNPYPRLHIDRYD